MGRLSLRLLMTASGLSLLALYGLVAIASYGFLVSVFPDRPDPIRLAVYFSLVALTVGYLSYRLGTAGLLRGLDAVELTPEGVPRLYARLDRIAPAFDVEGVTLYAARMEAPNALAIRDRPRRRYRPRRQSVPSVDPIGTRNDHRPRTRPPRRS